VHVLHAQVEHDQRIAAVEDGRQPAFAAERDLDGEASAAQHPAHEAGDVRLVVDDEDPTGLEAFGQDGRMSGSNHVDWAISVVWCLRRLSRQDWHGITG
jgi:hypothetical protein